MGRQRPIDQIAVGDLIPHRPPMQLLTQVLALGPDQIWSRVALDTQSSFVAAGSVPAVVMLEYLAQTAAAFFSLQSRDPAGAQSDSPPAPRPGMLIGCSRLNSSTGAIAVPATLIIEATLASALPESPAASTLVRFSGSVFKLTTVGTIPDDPEALIALTNGSTPIAEAALSVFLPAAPPGKIQ